MSAKKAAKKKPAKKKKSVKRAAPEGRGRLGEAPSKAGEITAKIPTQLAKKAGGEVGTKKLAAIIRSRMSTGCTPLDAICGGGLPLGRIVEIAGGYSVGKSTVLESVIAGVQQRGGKACVVLSEPALDPARMIRMGADPEAVLWNELCYVEEGFEWIEKLLKAHSPTSHQELLIGWDTIASCTSLDHRPGAGARDAREGLRKITLLLAQRRAVLLFINQISATFNRWATEPETPHGAGIRFHASIRILMTGQRRIKDETSPDKPVIGIEPIADCKKNKTFPPFRKCRVPIQFETGIDDDYAIFLYLRNLFRLEVAEEDGQAVNYLLLQFGEQQLRFKWQDYRKVLAETEGLREYMREQCLVRARRGFDPLDQ